MTSIHVIDESNFYQLYGIVTLIIIILLLWYFVRSNIYTTSYSCDRYSKYEGLSDGVVYDGMRLRRTYDKVLPNGNTFGFAHANLADVDETNYNDRNRQDDQIRAIHALSTGEPLNGNFKLRSLVDNDVVDVVDGDNANAQREGLNNPSGTPYNDFEELALPFATTKYPVGNVQLTNKDEPKPYNMQVGLYGGVPVTFYNEEDMLYSPEWYHGVGSGLYIQNMRTTFKKVNWPTQKAFW